MTGLRLTLSDGACPLGARGADPDGRRATRVELSMVKVECDGCRAPYQIDEKRIPPAGLKMRCPKCGTNLLVTRPPPGEADLPAVAGRSPPGAPQPSAPPIPRAAPPRPPPPRVPPSKAKASPLAELDVEPDSDHPKTRSGFGEIDLMVDLPAPAGETPRPGSWPGADGDLPAVRGAAAPAAADRWGEVDLPAVHGDLPAPAHPSSRADLPSPAAYGGPPGAPPRQRNPTVNFGDIDLPVAPHAGLPAPAGGRHTLGPGAPPPAPRMRGRTVNFGDIDLPSVPELSDLPEAQERGFGELDLPLVADEGAGLPVHSGAGLPVAAGNLPVAAHGAGLPLPVHGSSLPMPAQGSGLPMPAYGGGLPMSAQGAGLPVHAYGGGLPMSAQGAGLPVHASGGGLPMSAQGTGLPLHAPGGGLPMTADVGLPSRAFGDIDYGEELALDGAARSRSSAFDDSDRAVPSQMESAPRDAVGIDLAGPSLDALPQSSRPGAPATVGDEADLAAGPGASADGPIASQRRPREAEDAPKKSNARRIGVFAAVALALTGGALALVPTVGPFGLYFVTDQLNAKSNAAALDELRQAVDAQLGVDTHEAVSAAIEHCKAGQAALKRYRPARSYCAYVALERGLRFGRRTDDEALAKQLLIEAGDAGGDAAVLAGAALDVLSGQLDKARAMVTGLAQRAPTDLDVAVVAADVELADKAAAKAAVAAWRHAVELKKSPRTLFGLARAQVAAGDAKGAEASARAALESSPGHPSAHAGARTLIASVIWSDAAREAEALTLLAQVTDPGTDVRKAASEGELIDAYTQLGTIHLARSRISAAEQMFAAALKINPLAIRALIGDGELFYRSGRFSEALARFEAASNADATSVVAKVGIAKTWIALERMKDAKDMLKKLREAQPGEPLICLWLGHAEEALGNKKDAETAYAEAIKAAENRPEVVDAYVALAHLLSGIGRTDDANARLAEASKKFPDFPALHRARGEVALQMGRYEEARSELEAALAKEDDLGARFHLGVTLRRMRRFDEAGAIFDKVGAVDKDYPGLALERGLLFEETGQSDRALESYRVALQKAPNDVDLKLRVGSTQVMAGHALEAEKILEEVRKARPNSAEVNHFLGRALLVKGQNLAEAIRYLEIAVSIDSNRAEYYLYVGWAANELGQPVKAAPALNRALELDHELGDAYWQRGVLLQKQGATQDALRDLQMALEKRPSRFEAWATIALCDQDTQKWPEAEQAWRRALAGDDQHAEWHYRLGKLLAAHGNRNASGPELDKAVVLAERPNEPPHPWLFDAHFLLAEALRSSPANKAKTIEHYRRFLELAPHDNAYVKEAETALVGLGATPRR